MDQDQYEAPMQIKSCRWSWCRLVFLTDAQLREHVLNEHVQQAVPVRRGDIPLLRRAEEGYGDSLSLPNFSAESQINAVPHPTQQEDFVITSEQLLAGVSNVGL
jgi:hypothetical protein